VSAFLGLLNFIPSWVYAVLLAGALATNCVSRNQLAAERLAHQTAKADFAEERGDKALELAALATAYRAKEQAWQTEKEGIINDAQNKLKTAKAALPAAVAAGDELRNRIAQLTSKCSAPATAPSAGPGSPPANATDALLADVQRRLDKAAEELAGYADASRIAGQACELSYGKSR
jgi:hypothetical protein